MRHVKILAGLEKEKKKGARFDKNKLKKMICVNVSNLD